MNPERHPDGVVVVRARLLIARLVAAGCLPLRRHENGQATFAATSTVRQHIAEYAESRRRVKDTRT